MRDRANSFVAIAAVLVAVFVSACSDDTTPYYYNDLSSGPKDAGFGPNVDACNRIKSGSFTFVTPGTDMSSPVEVKVQTPNKVTITLNQAGWLKFFATVKGDWTFFLNMANLAFEVKDDQDATINPSTSETSVPQCAEVKAKHTVSLGAVGTYKVRLGPNLGIKVLLDIEPPLSSSGGG